MIENNHSHAILSFVGREDRALLESNPSARSETEADRAYPSNTGIRPCLPPPALGGKRKTQAFRAASQPSYIMLSLLTGGTYVTILRAQMRCGPTFSQGVALGCDLGALSGQIHHLPGQKIPI